MSNDRAFPSCGRPIFLHLSGNVILLACDNDVNHMGVHVHHGVETESTGRKVPYTVTWRGDPWTEADQ